MTNSRQQLYSKVAPLAQRQQAWQEALDSAENHVKLGLTLQGQGVEILKATQRAGSEADSLARLIQQATATIRDGIKIERDARDKVRELYQEQPK